MQTALRQSMAVSQAAGSRPAPAVRRARASCPRSAGVRALQPFQACKASRGPCRVYAVAAVAQNGVVNKALEGQARPIFPFTAIVGQEEMKLALILNIGGVMIMGDRGTGKSTTIRALADLLPEIKVVDKDPFNSDPDDPELMSEEVRTRIQKGESVAVGAMKIPMVDLPLGATEDRVCGTIDIEKALTEGVKAFEPGLLAKANRGILYVDEVNLLDDHLVDVLLDSAASGWNTVEREGISISHPARFILVGSGNPEEGELRPQLLDRFGMHAQIGTVREPELRVQIVEERSTFDEDPATFRVKYEDRQNALTTKIVEARQRLKQIEIQYDFRVKISQICSELNVDGIRGDIVTNRASKAIAAFEGRTEVAVEDIYRVIPLCLRHRLRKDPLADIDSGDKVREVFKSVFGME
ncbi:MAG: magnesium chelatase subunit of protochlorophyllide reductase [Monoraphidium minutum]|nr:MAG: magnesium chelatase subunit of protochlorophyllide reductase [Monoraphidium minutum]